MESKLVALRTLGAAALLASAFHAAPAAAQTSYWGSGTATAAAAGSPEGKDCDDEVARRQDMLREQKINDAVELAKSNYENPMASIGGFAKGSCLDRLMNPSLDGMFSPPNLSAILAMLEGFVCSQASNLMAQATAPLNRAIYQSLPIGEVIPGVNLGSLSGGMGVRVNQGGAAGRGSYVNTNLSQVWSRGQTGFGAYGGQTPMLFQGGLLDMRSK